MNFKKTLLATSVLVLHFCVFPSVARAEQDMPGVLSHQSQNFFNDVVGANKKAWLSRPHKHAALGHLVTTVCVQVDASGEKKCSVYESSGDKEFDDYALNVCKETPVGKPPDTWNPKTQIGVVFSSRVKTENTRNKFRDTNYVDTVKTATAVRWGATALPPEFKSSSLVAIVSSKVSEKGKATFELKTSSGNAKYDEFVVDLCGKTFIPVPPIYWDNSESVELMYASNEAGSALK